METKKQNPYRTGGPVRKGENFVGREREVEQILQALKKPQSVSIYGARRIGKTSLLYHLQDVIPAQLPKKPRVIYITMEIFRSEDEFFNFLAQQLQIESFSTLQELGEKLGQSNLVLLLDEFENVTRNDNFTDDFFHALRGWDIQGWLRAVYATKRPLSELSREGDLTSPFHNTLLSIEIGPISKDTARSLLSFLQEYVEYWPTNWQESVIDLTNCCPWNIQMFAYHAWEMLMENRKTAFPQVESQYHQAVDEPIEKLTDDIKPIIDLRPGKFPAQPSWWKRVPVQFIALLIAGGSFLAVGGLWSNSSWLLFLGIVGFFLAVILILVR